MLTEPARVLEVSGDVILLETSRKAACGKCSIKGGCGQYLLGSDSGVLQLNRQGSGNGVTALLPGSRVTLQMPRGAVAFLALLFYCLPLLLLIVFMLFAGIWTTDESAQIFSAFAGLAAGLLLLPTALRILSKRMPCNPLLGSSENRTSMNPERVDEN